MASKQGSKQPLSALEKKMMECSNLFEQSRGSSFAKPRLNASGATKPTYASGFNMPRPPQQQKQQPAHTPQVPSSGRLPVWCQRGDVPSMYRDWERQVTGPTGISGALVCSLLLSSGLSRPALGRIWDLCSRTVPGSFTQPELYATLALVAIAQAGHPPELELLSRLPQPPVPMFAQSVNVSTAPTTPLPQAWPSQMSPSPSPPSLPQPSTTCCPTFQASTNLFPSSTSSRPLQVAPPTSSVSSVTFVSSTVKPIAAVCASPVPPTKLVSSAPATFVSSISATSFVSSIPAMTFTTSVPAATETLLASSLSTAPSVPKLEAVAPSNPLVIPVTSSHPLATFVSVATPTVPKGGSPAPLSYSLVGASGECGGALGNGGMFATSIPSLMSHGCPVPTTLPSGSGDFDDEFDDFKSAPEQGHPQQPLATDSEFSQVKSFLPGGLSRVPSSQPPLIVPSVAHNPRKTTSLPDSPKLGPSKIAALNAHNSHQSQQRNNICKSPKMPKTFNFGLNIDLDSLMSSTKPPVSKPALVTNSISMPEQPVEVDDDFADFQTAFPEASKPSVPTEDRYSVFKELCDDGLSLWSVTDAPTSDSKDANMSADVVDAGGHTTETWHNPLPEFDRADEEDFGAFCHVQVIPPPAPVTPDKRANMFGGLLYNPGPFSSQSNDTISLGDGLSVNSLEFGAREGSLSSRHGSVLSLDFRLGNSDDDESASARTGCSDDARVAATADSQEEVSEAATSSDTTSDTQPEGAASVAEQPVLLLDKYSVIRGINQDAPVGEAACIDSWTRCLESVRELIAEADSIFNREASSQICREALDTEEGTSYIHNLAEVYKVCRCIALSSRLTGLQSENLDKLCSEVQDTWERLASYLENSCLFTTKVPPVDDAKWLPGPDESAKSCGLCLLHVDNPEIASSKLSYSGREYHSPCANLWVNCVNSLLPAVTPVQLL